VSTQPVLLGVFWDTMYAGRFHPGRPSVLEKALGARGTAHEALIGTPVAAEVVSGLRRKGRTDPDFARLAAWWEGRILAGPERLQLIAPGTQAVISAARLLALQPTSPATRKKKDGRSDRARRLSWSRDIELACIAATHGLPLASANRSDFEPIARMLDDAGLELVLVDDPTV